MSNCEDYFLSDIVLQIHVLEMLNLIKVQIFG
jgi:hypothetical protein